MSEIVDFLGVVITAGLQLLKVYRLKYKQVRRWKSEKYWDWVLNAITMDSKRMWVGLNNLWSKSKEHVSELFK